jgi:predicted RecB family nuclease
MSVRTTAWVSKIDLTRYLRCPYAFHLLDRGLVKFEDTVTKHEERLIQQGVEFQAAVEAKVGASPIKPADLPRVFAEESKSVFFLPIFENTKLKIYGRLDTIETAHGALIPVEIKSHKEILRSDELELAFYWMLLEPYRTKTVSPYGYLILRRDGVDEKVEVEIRPNRFEQVKGLLGEIRAARKHGVQPRICSCTVCSGKMRDEIDRATRSKKDLSRIWGIGPVYQRHLEEIGIKSYDELLGVDSASLVQRLAKQNCFVPIGQVDVWKYHANSYATSSPVLFGNPLPLNGPFFALDLEYEPGGLIWLVGVCLIGPTSREYIALWADNPAQEKRNLRRLAQIAAANPSLPVVTWNGNGADMPHLRNAVQRLSLGQELDMIESRHLDLFQYARKAVRFPIPQLALGQVATYFAIPKVSRIRNGLEALSQYQDYCQSRDEDSRAAIKTSLLEYNRDDLEALVGVAERISEVQRHAIFGEDRGD